MGSCVMWPGSPTPCFQMSNNSQLSHLHILPDNSESICAKDEWMKKWRMGKDWVYTCFLTLTLSQVLRHPELTGVLTYWVPLLLKCHHTAPS